MRCASTLLGLCAVGLLTCAAGGSPAQKKKPPTQAKKPPVTKPGTGAPGIKGAAMLPGDNGKIGQAYMMGAGLRDSYVFTLLGAEYSKTRFVAGDQATIPTAEQKLLLLRFSIHNTNNSELLVRFDTCKLTAIDSKDVNHEWTGHIVRAGDNKEEYDANLKPAQKIELVSVVVVPADVSVPKLMVHHPNHARVLRYDLRGQVGKLPQPYGDAGDPSGARALAEVPCIKGTAYPAAAFDFQLDGGSWVSENMGDMELEEGNRFAVFKITFKNATLVKQLLRFDTLDAELATADGDKIARKSGELLKATRNEGAGQEIDPGATYTGRIVFEVPKDVALAKLALWEGHSHHLVFDVSDLK